MVHRTVEFVISHFAHPGVLWLLLLLPLVAGGWRWVRRRRRRAEESWLGEHRPRSAQRSGQWLTALCWFVGLAGVIVGSAGPQWGRDPTAPPARGRDLWIAIDVSRSMAAEDPVCRLDRGKRYLRDLVEMVQRRGDYRLGLIAFAGKAKVLCPLTEDFDHFRYALALADPDRLGPAGRLGYNDDGSSFGTSLQAALAMAAASHDEQVRGYEHLLLITDGDDLAGNWQAGVPRLQSTGIAVHVLGIGHPETESFIPTGRADEPWLMFDGQRVTTRRHDDLLEELATAVHGDYQMEETSARPLADWFEQAVAPMPLREWTEDRQPLMVQRYGWFFGAALALFVAGLVWSDKPLAMEERS